MDLFVANDTVQNFLFVNRGPGPNDRWNWEEVALQAGVGFSESGRPRRQRDGMKVAWSGRVFHSAFSLQS